MKTTIFAIALAVLSFTCQAQALDLARGDAYYVGSINDGIPANEDRQDGYVNALTTLAKGTGDTVIGTDGDGGGNGETYNRVGSTLDGPFITADSANSERYTVNTAGLEGFTGFIVGKYDASNAGTLVWYVTNFTGPITVPTLYQFPDGTEKYGLSSLTFYGNTDTVVPEPASIALLGLGGLLAGYGVSRRKKKTLEEMVS